MMKEIRGARFVMERGGGCDKNNSEENVDGQKQVKIRETIIAKMS